MTQSKWKSKSVRLCMFQCICICVSCIRRHIEDIGWTLLHMYVCGLSSGAVQVPCLCICSRFGFFFSQRLTGRTNWRLTFWIFGYLELAFIGFVDLDHWNGVCLSVDMSICLSMLQTQNWKQGPTETGLWRGSGYINVYMYI